MRGLVVFVGIVLLSWLLLGNITTAETKKETTVITPAVVSCTTSNGTYVSFKANVAVKNLDIEGICQRDEVPAGWTVQCYTSEARDGVSLSFDTPDGTKESHVVCG